MLWGLITTLVLLFVTGPNMVAQLVHPTYYLTKFVTILNFIQNIDSFYITFWVFGNFIKLSVYLFILSYGVSEWTGYKNWKLISFFMTIVWLAFVIYSSHHIRISHFVKNIYLVGYFYPFVYIGIPLLLWIIGSIRNALKRPASNSTSSLKPLPRKRPAFKTRACGIAMPYMKRRSRLLLLGGRLRRYSSAGSPPSPNCRCRPLRSRRRSIRAVCSTRRATARWPL